MSSGYVLGLNQYTHSASACLLDAAGEAVFALAKERVTRKKYDGGDNAAVVRAVLEGAGIDAAALDLVVANNHLFRIRPFERNLQWAVALNQHPSTYLDPCNLLPEVAKHELSHHLAHAWSVLDLAPFDRGLVVVADGIGSAWADVERRSSGSQLGPYHSDADLPAADGFVQVPADLPADATWREAESVYRFDGRKLERLFKRWAQEHTPVFLYNYGFENQDSLGAVYSRVASHVFGDWNACGKVMGLAPWAGRWGADEGPQALMTGPLEELAVDFPRLRSAPDPNRWRDHGDRAAYARLAADLQHDLEEVLLEFLTRLRRTCGERNLCLVGGVALNSTANGRIAREAGFDQVFVPPWPGDDGVAVGCALYGHQLLHPQVPPRRSCYSPYLGGRADADAVDEALHEFEPWIDVEILEALSPEIVGQASNNPAGEDPRVRVAADALAAGATVGWFQGRSEFGPRALGNRSILATPADAGMIERINRAIKKREGFRPFAPTVLAEHADEWFEGVTPSPFMSLTVPVREHQRARIPAVVHVDGSARIQTLERARNPLYYDLVQAFHQRSGLPMVLNTSFNIRGEPIVESAADALRHFLDSDLDLLVLEDRLVRARPFPDKDQWQRLIPRARPGFSAEVVSNEEGEAVSVNLLGGGGNWESDQLELGVLEACDGELSVAGLCADFEQEFEVEAEQVVTRLQRLYRWRLISFQQPSQ